jgi:hypothetical protein
MKRLVKEYSFDRDNQEITSSEFAELRTENILLVVNVSLNQVIYNPINSAFSGTLSGLTLQLSYDTSGMNAADDLQIWIDDGIQSANNDNLDALVYFASAIHEKLPVCDTLDRALVVAAQSGAWSVNAVQSGGWNIATVTTVGALTSLQNNAPTALAAYNWASGAYHIYNGIEVS